MDTPQQTPLVQQTPFDQFTDRGKEDSNGNKVSENSLLVEYDDQGKTAIIQLRDAMQDCKLRDSSDEYLFKWVSVYGYDVAHAEKMFRQSLEWRRVNAVDNILKSYTPCEVLKKYHFPGLIGIDKFGSPVFIQVIGKIDFKGIVMSVPRKELHNYNIWNLERFVYATQMETKKRGRIISRTTYIFDYEGFSLRTLTCKSGAYIMIICDAPASGIIGALDFILETAKYISHYYPDSSRRLFIINAPSFFPLIFSMMKPFLHESDIPKIKIFGSDKNEWTSALLEEIDADQLPAFYGGTLTDPNGDPKCPSKFNMAGKIPSSYYMKNNAPVAKDCMETISIMAGVGGRKKLKYNVDIAHSVLRWEFMTEGGDLGFCIYHSSVNDLVPHSRVDSHLSMEEGHIICDQPGKYVVEFDNTHSYLKTKKLRYHIAIDPPSTENS